MDTYIIKRAFKQALVENAAIIVLSVFALLTMMLASSYAPHPVTWGNVKDIHEVNIRQHIYLLLVFYFCVYGFGILAKTNNNMTAYTKRVICYKHIFASVILILCCTIQFLSFCFFKISIPYINFYSWDDVLINLDWILLFKHHAWVLVKSITPNFEMIEIYNFIYLSWIPITSTILFWQQVSVNRAVRIQYLTSLLATWLILGCWCAVLFSSVGPCFYESFYNNPPYIISLINSHIGPLGENLGLLSTAAKKSLLDNYLNETFILVYGISAFPSLHIATTVLHALAITKRFRRLAPVVWSYAVLILLSCIYLGFHYLVDCIFGILGAFTIWHVTAKLYASNWYKNWQSRMDLMS